MFLLAAAFSGPGREGHKRGQSDHLDDLAENRRSPQPMSCDSRTVDWPRQECLALGNKFSAQFTPSQTGRVVTPVKQPLRPQTPIKESWGSVWEKRVSVCPYPRWLSLGHPSLGGAQLDHTGGIAGDQCGKVPVGPW